MIWVVGVIGDGGGCALNFPSRAGEYPNNITFRMRDNNEVYLAAFDRAEIKVWLQVEPGDADVLALIDLVLGRYASHPSVIGLGVDVEWYRYSESNPEGVAVTDTEAQAWSERVRAYNPDYHLFLKHWLTEKMPPVYRTGIVFVDDSQMFSRLNDMVDEFALWGRTFAPAPVAFQFGYPADREWWGVLADPPVDIGRAILERVPNAQGLYWVDFTAYEMWPR